MVLAVNFEKWEVASADVRFIFWYEPKKHFLEVLGISLSEMADSIVIEGDGASRRFFFF